eukprot:6537369-Alexandrium_andersonii.AAC.1
MRTQTRSPTSMNLWPNLCMNRLPRKQAVTCLVRALEFRASVSGMGEACQRVEMEGVELRRALANQ